jgi:hypothetical protein
MTRRYKRKRLMNEMILDQKDHKDIRKSVEVSNRQEGKQECTEGEREYLDQNISLLRWEIEMYYANRCTSEICKCPSVNKMSEEEVLIWHGLLPPHIPNKK